MILPYSCLIDISSLNTNKKNRTHRFLPNNGTFYAFPFDTNVDATEIDCGHLVKEDISDLFKKILGEITQTVTLSDRIALGNAMHEKLVFLSMLMTQEQKG